MPIVARNPEPSPLPRLPLGAPTVPGPARLISRWPRAPRAFSPTRRPKLRRQISKPLASSRTRHRHRLYGPGAETTLPLCLPHSVSVPGIQCRLGIPASVIWGFVSAAHQRPTVLTAPMEPAGAAQLAAGLVQHQQQTAPSETGAMSVAESVTAANSDPGGDAGNDAPPNPRKRKKASRAYVVPPFPSPPRAPFRPRPRPSPRPPPADPTPLRPAVTFATSTTSPATTASPSAASARSTTSPASTCARPSAAARKRATAPPSTRTRRAPRRGAPSSAPSPASTP